MRLSETVPIDTWGDQADVVVERLDNFVKKVHRLVDRARELGATNVRVILQPSASGFGATVTGEVK